MSFDRKRTFSKIDKIWVDKDIKVNEFDNENTSPRTFFENELWKQLYIS